MAAHKGKTPKHVTARVKTAVHPRQDHPLIAILDGVNDPRGPSLFSRHPLTSILFMTLIAVLCGTTDWPKIVVASRGMKEWLSKYVDMSSGVPCERTFMRIFQLLDPESLEGILRQISGHLREQSPGELISFDGQTLRGSADKAKGLSGIHLLNAWSSEHQACLGQLKVDEKSNEITAMPQLMDLLELKGAIITADAMNTQKNIVQKTIDKGADYVLPVKGNHPGLKEEIESAFDFLDKELARGQANWDRAVGKAREHRDEKRLSKLLREGAPTYGSSTSTTLEKEHGRIECRTCTVMPVGNLPARREWAGLQSIARICREFTLNGVTTFEITYYISSLKSVAELIAQVARKHWGVEVFHWYLDVVFRQDKSRYRNRVGARNLAVLRKLASQALLREDSLKRGLATKQCAAAWDSAYREKLLKNFF